MNGITENNVHNDQAGKFLVTRDVICEERILEQRESECGNRQV